MKVPSLSEDELEDFLKGKWVAKIATTNRDGTICITPIWFENHGPYILMNTFEKSRLVSNLKRSRKASLLIDSFEWPYKGVHFTGEADFESRASTAQEIGRMFARFVGTEEAATQYGEKLISWGKRVFVKFYPKDKVTYDFSKG